MPSLLFSLPVAESMAPDRPALLTLDPTVQHQATVLHMVNNILTNLYNNTHLALEAGQVEILS